MLIDRKDKEWSIKFVREILSYPKGLSQLEDLFTRHETVWPMEECPHKIFTYEDMMFDNCDQDICGKNEVVLSEWWVGEEEKMQVLTYRQLERIVSWELTVRIFRNMFKKKRQEKIKWTPRPPETPIRTERKLKCMTRKQK